MFNGKINHARLFRRVLTDKEITILTGGYDNSLMAKMRYWLKRFWVSIKRIIEEVL